MKKTLLAAATTAAVALSVGAFAQTGGFSASGNQAYNAGGYQGPAQATGGFQGPSMGLSTVAQAKQLRDDSWVALEGYLVRQVGHELYEFKDNSGSIIVDIDDKRWLGQQATPKSKIRIEGEVDREWNSIEIDVKAVRVL